MIRRLFATDDSIATAILRLVLGLAFFAHGAQKMLGWFGGFGFSGTMGFFTGAMGLARLRPVLCGGGGGLKRRARDREKLAAIDTHERVSSPPALIEPPPTTARLARLVTEVLGWL